MIAPVLALVASLASAQVVTGELGSDQIEPDDADDCFKLDVIDVQNTVNLVTISPWIKFEIGHAGADSLHFVVYEETTPNDWELLWDSGLVGPLGVLDGFKDSPPVNEILQAGRRYAVGFVLEDGNFVYEYEDPGGPGTLTWAASDGAINNNDGDLQFSPDPVPDVLNNLTPAGHSYYMELTAEILDQDGDGSETGVDCDDADPARYPGAPEYCDGVDNDCSGTADDNVVYTDAYADADGDGFGDPNAVTSYCEASIPAGLVADATDCDDTRPAVNPTGTEVCDGIDQDCDGLVDEDLPAVTWWPDEDGDGFGDENAPVVWCDVAPAGVVDNGFDCDDADAERFPGNDEVCDGKDNDCDGLAGGEEDFDADGSIDCEDCGPDDATIYPGAPELCDGIDHDCDGVGPTALDCDPAPDEKLAVEPCGCRTGAGPAHALGLLGLLWYRRRRVAASARNE